MTEQLVPLQASAALILELDRGRGIPYEGNYTKYLDAKAKRLIQEGREDDARQKAIWREREWIASSLPCTTAATASPSCRSPSTRPSTR